jgi:hypothetical protein
MEAIRIKSLVRIVPLSFNTIYGSGGLKVNSISEYRVAPWNIL